MDARRATLAARIGAAVWLCLVAAAAPLHAQSELGERREQARERHRQAVRAFAKRDYDGAIELSKQADGLLPSAAISYNIARAYEARGDHVAAASWYRDYLERAPRASDRQRVERKITRLERLSAERDLQPVSVSTSPSGARVWVDEREVGVSPWLGELRVGLHSARATLSGYDDAGRAFLVESGQRANVELTLERSVAVATPRAVPVTNATPALVATSAVAPTQLVARSPPRNSARAAPGASPKKQRRARSSGSVVRTLGIASLIGGAAGLGGAFTFELLRRSAEDEARTEREQIAYARDVQTMRDRAQIARVLVVVGGVAAVSGVVLIALAPGDSTERAPRAELALGLTPHDVRLDLRGRY